MSLLEKIFKNALADFGITEADLAKFKKVGACLKKLSEGVEFDEQEDGSIRVIINSRMVTIFLENTNEKV